jgi:hypothetical protein
MAQPAVGAGEERKQMGDDVMADEQVKRVALDQIIWDPNIYPRQKYSMATIARYTEALGNGADFPPVTVEKGTLRLLDGKHRFEAHKQAELSEIAIQEETIPDGVPVKLFAASLSARHGDRLENADAKRLAREIATDSPDYDMASIARLLSFKYSTVASWVSDIVAKNREQRMAWVRRLRLLGWTQQEIGDALGWSRRRTGELAETGDFSKSGEIATPDDAITSLLATGLGPEDVAQRLGISVQLALAVDFQRQQLDDAARCDVLGITVQPYDVWSFPRCHDLMGDQHPGRIPGELVTHTLYFFTEPNELIIDPMGGSGTTPDACLLLGRRCYAYDIDHRHQRPDIIDNDLAKGWPSRTAKADLIFWDPPYFAKKDADYVSGSISGLDRHQYLEFFATALHGAHERVRRGARLALVMADWEDAPTWKQLASADPIWISDYLRLLEDAGWSLVRHIQCPLSTQQVHPDIVQKFRVARRLARLERYLLLVVKR